MLQSERIHKFQMIIHSAFIFRVKQFRKNPLWTAWPWKWGHYYRRRRKRGE